MLRYFHKIYHHKI